MLESKSIAPAASSFDAAAKIERLVITHNVAPSVSSVKLRGSGESIAFSVDKNVVVVKQPGVGAGDDFAIEFS